MTNVVGGRADVFEGKNGVEDGDDVRAVWSVKSCGIERVTGSPECVWHGRYFYQVALTIILVIDYARGLDVYLEICKKQRSQNKNFSQN